MANLLGVQDMKQWALPAGIDAEELYKWKLADGTTYDVVVNELVSIVQAVNVTLFNNPIYSGLFSLTTEDHYTYESGSASTMERRSEYTVGDPRKTKEVAHTLPLGGFEHPLKWTRDYLENANMERIRMGLRAAGRAVRNNLEKEVLTRFFSSAENQINGGGGYDMPFVNASSTVVYTPIDHDGLAFASSHTHFDRQADSAAGRAAAVSNGAIHLYEHGFMPPYELIIPFTDKNDWAQVSSTSPYALYFKPERDQLTFADTANFARFGDEVYVGGIDTSVGVVRIWTTSRLPTDYCGMYKSFGANAMGNPLALRYKPLRGAGALVIASENSSLPLVGATVQHDFGVGVGSERLNGYACYFAGAGDYVTPTIS